MHWHLVIFLINGKPNHTGLSIPGLGLADLSLLGARIVPWTEKSIPKGERSFYEFALAKPEQAIEFLKQPGLLMKEILREEKACRGWHLTEDAPDLVRQYRGVRSIDVNSMNCVEWIVRAIELGGVPMPMDVLTPTDLVNWCKIYLRAIPSNDFDRITGAYRMFFQPINSA